MLRVLFLDDDPQRHEQFASECTGFLTVAFSHEEAVAALNEHVFDIVFLDHDLGDFTPQGYGEPRPPDGDTTARFIAQMPPERRPRLVVIHSWNVVGAARMANTLREVGIEVVVVGFCKGIWKVASDAALFFGS